MFWIALCPTTEADRSAWTWWSLRFTPRVTHVDEAVLLEVSGSLKLFGGRKALLHLLLRSHADLGEVPWAAGPTSLVALALLRCKQRGIAKPAEVAGRPAARVAHRRLAARRAARAHRHPHLGAGAGHAARRPGTPVRRRVPGGAGCGFRRSPGNLPLAAAAGTLRPECRTGIGGQHRARPAAGRRAAAHPPAGVAAGAQPRRAGARTRMDAGPAAPERREAAAQGAAAGAHRATHAGHGAPAAAGA
jgi:hypothetical protein